MKPFKLPMIIRVSSNQIPKKLTKYEKMCALMDILTQLSVNNWYFWERRHKQSAPDGFGNRHWWQMEISYEQKLLNLRLRAQP